MAPDADKLRRRHNGVDVVDKLNGGDGQHDQATESRIACKKELRGTEVAIEGVIYDLTSFDHPGGDGIFLFGGNDVTVTYKMIHPYHTERHLEKLKKVGLMSDYKPEYKFDTPFEREIKSEVFKIVRRGKEFGTRGFFFRVVFYVSFLFACAYAWAVGGSSIPLAIVFGVAQAWIGLNVQHDANHGAASRKSWVNDLLGYGADCIGGNKWLWMEQHWTHHSYTNHASMDPDSFSAEPMLLFNDYPKGHPARKFVHKFQALLFLPILSFYWLSSVFNPQILDLKQRGALGVGIALDNDFLQRRRKYAIAMRLAYIFICVVTPFMHNGGWGWTPFAHIMLMGITESLTLAILFSLSHNFENSDRNPTEPYEKSGEPVCWFKSQVETSSTYGGRVAGWLTGGLNFQIEHHLFPRMSSAWYPYIAPTVRRVCEKHGVRYVYYPTVFQNFVSTVRYMHSAGNGFNWETNPLSGKA